MFQIARGHVWPIYNDVRDYENIIRITGAYFSDCGSFCFLHYGYHGTLKLSSTHLERWCAKMQIPSVWGRQTSYNGRLFDVVLHSEHGMVELYQAISRPLRNGLCDSPWMRRLQEHTIAVQITPCPNHLATMQVHLLVGKNGDDLVRISFLPYQGLPEIKHLRVTLNQILTKLEEAARAAQSKLDELFQQFYETSEEESGNSESEVAMMSADEDESENLETD